MSTDAPNWISVRRAHATHRDGSTAVNVGTDQIVDTTVPCDVVLLSRGKLRIQRSDGTVVELNGPTILLGRELGTAFACPCDWPQLIPLSLEKCARLLAQDKSFRDTFFKATTRRVRTLQDSICAQIPIRAVSLH